MVPSKVLSFKRFPKPLLPGIRCCGHLVNVELCACSLSATISSQLSPRLRNKYLTMTLVVTLLLEERRFATGDQSGDRNMEIWVAAVSRKSLEGTPMDPKEASCRDIFEMTFHCDGMTE